MIWSQREGAIKARHRFVVPPLFLQDVPAVAESFGKVRLKGDSAVEARYGFGQSLQSVKR